MHPKWPSFKDSNSVTILMNLSRCASSFDFHHDCRPPIMCPSFSIFIFHFSSMLNFCPLIFYFLVLYRNYFHCGFPSVLSFRRHNMFWWTCYHSITQVHTEYLPSFHETHHIITNSGILRASCTPRVPSVLFERFALLYPFYCPKTTLRRYDHYWWIWLGGNNYRHSH